VSLSPDASRLLELHRELCNLDAREAPRSEKAPVVAEMKVLVVRISKDELAEVLKEAYSQTTPEQVEEILRRRMHRQTHG
jgi:hypothetical protein